MFYVRLLALFLLAATTSCAQPDNSTATRLGLPVQDWTDGWISLFDGQSLFGWQPTSDAHWKVVDGTMTVSSGSHGFLHTTTQFADFELTLEYSCPAETNSGVFIRSAARPKNPNSDCYEINIAPADNPFPTGSIVGRTKADLELGVTTTEPAWHRMKIVANQSSIRILVDGQQACQYSDEKPLGRGLIGLQFRGDEIAFRNIRLKPLGLTPIFNGEDLAGWTDEKADQSRFFVEDGLLRVLNGRGQLETTKAYADFVLQLECQTHADGLNSGVFFRCLPGDQMMGYESQIQNAMKDGDPTQPADCGTGGIFRRQNARTIVAEDQTWFAKTIIADGAHIATWVNGHQVTDWTDDRQPHTNPRKGLRLEAGTIMIQGHDPTTDLSFRNLKISETTPR